MFEGGADGISVRNLVSLNGAPNALGFAAAAFGLAAREIRIDELGPAYLTACSEAPGVPDMRVLLPRTIAFSPSEDGLSRYLTGLLGPRMLVAHSARSAGRLERLHRMVGFDAACLSAAIDVEAARDALFPLTLLPELGIPGLEGVRFFGNAMGLRSLDTALALIDAARRRRRRVRAHVYDVSELALSAGFYPVERDRAWAWAWTGPDSIATVLVPSHGEGRMMLTLFFFSTKFALDADHLRVLVGGVEARCAYFPDENKVEVAADCTDPLCTRVDLVQTEMVVTADHSRFIGLALHKVKLERDR